MNALKRRKGLLVVAAVVLVGQTVVPFTLEPSVTRAGSVAVAALVASLLLRGIRFAWVVAFLGAAGQLISSAIAIESYGDLAAGAIVVICLLAPSSFRFVWNHRRHQRAEGLQLAVKRSYEKTKASAYGLLTWVAGWETQEPGRDASHKQRSYRLLIWRLGVGCVLLLALVGASYDWQQGSGRDSPVINAIATVAWTSYAVVQLTFIAASMVAVYRHFAISREPPESPRS